MSVEKLRKVRHNLQDYQLLGKLFHFIFVIICFKTCFKLLFCSDFNQPFRDII